MPLLEFLLDQVMRNKFVTCLLREQAGDRRQPKNIGVGRSILVVGLMLENVLPKITIINNLVSHSFLIKN